MKSRENSMTTIIPMTALRTTPKGVEGEGAVAVELVSPGVGEKEGLEGVDTAMEEVDVATVLIIISVSSVLCCEVIASFDAVTGPKQGCNWGGARGVKAPHFFGN